MEQQEKETYDFRQKEEEIRKFWENEKIFRFNEKDKGKIFSIDTPPPTVSGKMHMGHAFSYSQQDFIARYKRMKGFNVYYPFGTDDNGLPTERLVEKTKGIKAKDLPREKFIELCLGFLKQELPKFIQDWKNIGMSCDFDLYYSTINDYSRKISQWSFIDLHKKGRVYRKDAPSMYCPECQTGISQVECKDKELESEFVHLKFKTENKGLIIATTRPELLPGCVAVFYHPSDSRFKHLKGKKAKVPLFDFSVPIMEDLRVDMEKGTGIVMCCTFGDQVDMEWQKAHNLPIKEAITKEGKMSALAGKYQGMRIKEARKAMVADLEKNNLVLKREKIKHFVNVHERCNTEIEFIKNKQWFVRYLDLKSRMLEWGKKLSWYPGHMASRYNNWVNGLQWDWLISRQRYFGVPFPVWYCTRCNKEILAEESELPVDPLKGAPDKKCSCGSREFVGEKDVLDTWFTSSMTPRLATEFAGKKIQEKLFPMDLRPQAHDIITFWLFNTMVKSNLHYNTNPFRNVMISGFVTLEGEKMSKSTGNVIEPQAVLEKYGADAMRYWAASSRLGEDLDYQEKEIIAGRKFVTKIFNASRFIFLNLKKIIKKPEKLEEIDRLFLARLNRIIEISGREFENYEYAKVKNETINFFWHDFCDNYLEIVKRRVYSGNEKEKTSAFYTLYYSLLSVLKLMAPITPFITEELYRKYYIREGDRSIHLSKWPEKFRIKEKDGDESRLGLLLEIIYLVRQEKSKKQKSMKAEIILTLEKEKIAKIKDVLEDLKAVANAGEIKEGSFKVEFV